MATAKITSKGQTTIPKSVRDSLHLKPGDKVEFVVQPNGTALMVPKTRRLADLKGFLPRPERGLTIEEMNAGVRRHLTRKYRRACG